MSIFAPKYPNMSLHNLYERALGCESDSVDLMIEEIIDDKDHSDVLAALSKETARLRREIRMGLIAAGLL
jgi:hypothetical protein